MNESQLVRGFERLGDLFGDLQRIVNRNGALRDPICERDSFDQFEDKPTNPVRFLQAVDVGDVWMIQRGEHLRLALEPGKTIRIGRYTVWQDFDCNVAIELRVARAIDLAHPAPAERSEDFVRAEACAGSEGHEEFRTAGGAHCSGLSRSGKALPRALGATHSPLTHANLGSVQSPAAARMKRSVPKNAPTPVATPMATALPAPIPPLTRSSDAIAS